MTERDYLAERFQEHRTRLRAVAYRMLGSLSEVDDAVQEAWLTQPRRCRRTSRLLRCDALSSEELRARAGDVSMAAQEGELAILPIADHFVLFTAPDRVLWRSSNFSSAEQPALRTDRR